MTVVDFLSRWAGDWFAQRTTYDLPEGQVANHKANLQVESLEETDPDRHVFPTGGQAIRLRWDTSVDWNNKKEEGQALLWFATEAPGESGRFLRQIARPGSPLVEGTYRFAPDGAILLTLAQDGQTIEERQWFVSDNFKLRMVMVQDRHGFSQTTFYSEIRRILTPPKAETSTATAEVS